MSNYPLVSFHFSVQWGGSKIGFSEVSGLSIEHELIEYREGSSPEYTTLKMPGLKKFSNIILKRGSCKGDNEFFSWTNSITSSKVERRDIIISLLNEDQSPVLIWTLNNAWPISLKFAELNAMKSEILIESLEIAYQGINLEYK